MQVPRPSEEFKKYDQPAVAVDVIVFSLTKDSLKVGLHKRGNEPYKNLYSLPGRFVRYDEPVEETAHIALKEKAGIDGQKVYLEQLYTFGQETMRDTRIRTISIVYYAVLNLGYNQARDQSTLEWIDVTQLPEEMAFDHKKIVQYAYERLQSKLRWGDLAHSIMPEKFTLTELQRSFEIILGEELDKRNFRKKVTEDPKLVKLNEKRQEGIHRPAFLYTFSE